MSIAKKCTISGCEGRHEGLGYCIKHYLRYKRYGDAGFWKIEKHGMTDTPEYSSWSNMKSRCYYPGNNRYEQYGGRGIEVCPEWRNCFSAFYRDMGERPDGYSLDRIDPEQDYKPTNCRWSDSLVQAANRRSSLSKRSGVRGITWESSRQSWKVAVTITGKHRTIGRYKTLTEAVSAKQAALLCI